MLKRPIGLGAPLVALMSCSSDEASSPEMLGEVRIAIVQVPTDVRCAELVVQGNRTVQKRFDLTPGQPSTPSMNQLPVGQVAFSASPFDSACAAVTATSVPTWLSEQRDAQSRRRTRAAADRGARFCGQSRRHDSGGSKG